MRKKLTDRYVECLKAPPSNERLEVFDATFPGLAIRVTNRGHKSWSVYYRANGRHVRYTIGPFPAFLPAAARKAASDVLHRVEAGGDPAEEKRARRRAAGPLGPDDMSFAAVARRYLKQQVEKNTAASTYRETARIIDQDVTPVWGKRPIGSIARRDVSALIDAKAFSGAEVQANRVLARLRTLFGWAVAKDLIEKSPCDGLRPPTKERARDRVLSEIWAFWLACHELGWPFGPLFQLLLLTAQRRDEVGSLKWSEIDLERRLWSLPRDKAKNDQGHDVHLSAQAAAILAALPHIGGTGGYVFTTNGRSAVSGFSRAKERLDALMAKAAGHEIEPWILHDLRRTAATGMARLKVAPHVVDRVLNHTSGTIRGVARVYNRFEYYDERKAALEAWGTAVQAIVEGAETSAPSAPSNVVDLATARG
jgi:integrase